ncbi:MAG TPA: Clp protease N-terminal domain-containing protein [Candidatus Melainabacteria bacterium]|nr:Clp protease N-terminal domain-containing protein [Candidatus Melainabacteria bacterium]
MMNNYNIQRICTSSAERALLFANEEAKKSGHDVDARHLMLGLLREGKGIGAKHLNQMKVSAESVRELVREEPRTSPFFRVGLQNHLERAFEECIRLGHDFIGSEHLLLSILDDCDNGEIFRQLKVNPTAARTNLLQMIGS